MQKPPPQYSLEFVLHPEHDTTYQHFANGAGNPFQAKPAGLPRVNAWWLAEAALLSYWKPQDAIPIFRNAGFECEYRDANSTECYIASQKDWVVVAFRGTQPDEWEDMLTDANVVLVPWRTGLVHCGFKEGFEAIVPQLDAILPTLTASRTLWFCGHSLGAALATLAADHYGQTSGVCTFGSPRVGDLVFAAAFSAKFIGRSLRYVNDHDVVTHVPVPIPYKHVDLRRFIDAAGTISNRDSDLEHFFPQIFGAPKQLLTVIDSLRSVPGAANAPDCLLDHMAKAYPIWLWNDYDANG